MLLIYLFDKNAKKGYFKGCRDSEDGHTKRARFRYIARIIIRLIVFFILLPVAAGDLLVRKVCKLHDTYARPFEDNLLKIIKDNSTEIVRNFSTDNSNNTEGDTFRLIYHYALEHSSNHVSKMQNYVALYGFTRTLTFVGCILFWEWTILSIYNSSKVTFLLFLKDFLTINTLLPLFFIFFITFFLYWDFNKFYRKFSMEAYLGAVVASKKE